MKTDSLFYRMFQTAPSLLFELIERSPTEATSYEFRSVELKQTAFRIDGVLLPINQSVNRPIYFVEVQFQKDPQLYHRVFAEIFLYLAQNPDTDDWEAVLIYPNCSVEPDESKLYTVLLDSPKVRQVYLDELDTQHELSLGLEITKLVIEPEETAPAQARRLIARAQQEEVTGMTREEFVKLVETIIVYKFSHLSRKEIETMLGLGELKQTRVYQEALEEGREEGREEGLLEAIAEILETRFGESARKLTQALARNTEMTVLKEYLRQAIAVTSLEEFEQIVRGTQRDSE
jgi:predicted transposase/invertase (TIGR01784 family)